MTERSRIGALSLNARAILRQLGSQPAVVLTIFVATLVGAFLIASAPRSLEQAAGEDLRAAVVDPPPAMRNIRVEQRSRIAPGPEEDPMRNVRSVGENFAETQFPDSVSAIISGSHWVVDTGRFAITPMAGEEPPHPFPMYLRFRLQDGVFDRMRVVAGSTPEDQPPVPLLIGLECPHDQEERDELIERLLMAEGDGEEIDCDLEEVPHLQVMVSEATREALGLELNQQMLMSPDRLDPFYFGLDFRQLEFRLVISISGVMELEDPSEDYWFGDGSLHAPRVRQNADLRIIYATGLTVEDEFARIVGALGQIDRGHTWRYQVAPDLVAEADPARLEADLESLQAEFSNVASRFHSPVVITRLPDLLEDHQQQRQQTLAVLSVQVAGLIAIVVAVLLLLELLMTTRQQKSTVLVRGRGASSGQLGLTRLYEALLLIVPASLVGYAVAGWLMPGTAGLASYRATVGLVGIAAAAAVVAVAPTVRRPLGELIAARTGRPKDPSRVRLVVELGVLALTAGAIVLLRRRGEVQAATSSQTEIDPLLAVAPVLIAVSAGLVLLRAFPSLVKAMGWFATRSRGVVGIVGLRRIFQQVFVERLPILVIVVCVAMASFSMLGRATINAGQVAASWHEVGADYRVTNFSRFVPLPSAVSLDEPGIEKVAFGVAIDDARAVAGVVSARTSVMAIDAAAYGAVTAGTAGDPSLPESVVASGESVGTPEQPIPVIVSRFWPGGVDLTVGDVFVLDMGRLEPNVEVAEIRERYPDIDEGGSFVVLDLQALESFSDLPLQPTVAYVRAPESAGPNLSQALTEQSSLAVLTSRYQALEDASEDPFVAWATTTMGLLFFFGVGLAGVTAISALALGSAARSRDLAYMRTMGLLRRQALMLTTIEQLPSLVIATLAGIATGLGTGWLLEPAIDFTPLTGGSFVPTTQIDWAAMAAAASFLLLAVAAGIGIFLIAFREQELTRVLRVGDEQ
jgi:putative ABC transport system permease protein